jgi:8-oxo-dGTP diphosphatase
MTIRDDRVGIGVGVIVRHEGRVLLGRRLAPPGANTWQFPGGKLEFGETVEACAARETLEEAGIVIGDLARGPYTSDVFGRDEAHYVTLFVVAALISGVPEVREPTKCTHWSWYRWGALPRPLFQPIESLLATGFSLVETPQRSRRRPDHDPG